MREAGGFGGEAWGLAVGDEVLVVREACGGFVTLLRREQHFDVEWSEPETAHARFGRRNELLGLSTELIGCYDLRTTQSNLRETTQGLEVRIQQTRRRLLQVSLSRLERFVKPPLLRLRDRETRPQQRKHAILANRFRDRDPVDKVSFRLFDLAEKQPALRGIKMNPRATFA